MAIGTHVAFIFAKFLVLAVIAQSQVSEFEDRGSPVERLPQEIRWTNDQDELDPSQLLAAVHYSNDEESSTHHLSNSLLRVTKDLLSFSPRSKTPQQQRDLEQILALIQAIKEEEVRDLLSQHAIAVPTASNITCHFATKFYRTMDGSCNNPVHPCWGKTEQPYQRWLPPVYANGIDELRRRADGGPLPSPRQVYQWVSSQFEQTSDTTYSLMTNLLLTWGQLIAHDLMLTPSVTIKVWNGWEVKNEKPRCCNTSTPHPECMPIIMNYADGYYPYGHCMDIVRSVAYTYSPTSCMRLKLGVPRQQMNQLTAFLDASVVYGTSDKEMLKLREYNGHGAKLAMDYSSKWSCPIRRNSTCRSTRKTCDNRCFLVGERRSNENPVLGALHTIWAREHNRIVDVLRARQWPEETLFHVARKILGALLQHITYNEYLPTILGPTLTSMLNLRVPTPQYQYNPSVNPTLYNVFATAAFRYGHSMISKQIERGRSNLSNNRLLSQDFFSMDDFCDFQGDPIAALLTGQLDQKVQKIDCVFSRQVTNHLFAKSINGRGLDLFSLNIQRGRDHGLPPYNKWREACGLSKARDYSDLRGTHPNYIIGRLESAYGPGSVDEIDLFVGGISELPVNDGILGPTFTCIVSHQFRNLKFGDRFWYENTNHPGAFTQDQIKSIQKTTLASLLCRNSDIQEIQQLAFYIHSPRNQKIPCSAIVQQTDLDFNLWP